MFNVFNVELSVLDWETQVSTYMLLVQSWVFHSFDWWVGTDIKRQLTYCLKNKSSIIHKIYRGNSHPVSIRYSWRSPSDGVRTLNKSMFFLKKLSREKGWKIKAFKKSFSTSKNLRHGPPGNVLHKVWQIRLQHKLAENAQFISTKVVAQTIN